MRRLRSMSPVSGREARMRPSGVTEKVTSGWSALWMTQRSAYLEKAPTGRGGNGKGGAPAAAAPQKGQGFPSDGEDDRSRRDGAAGVGAQDGALLRPRCVQWWCFMMRAPAFGLRPRRRGSGGRGPPRRPGTWRGCPRP